MFPNREKIVSIRGRVIFQDTDGDRTRVEMDEKSKLI